mmetsp:Transcript_50657/g.82904  ORF Transcript_50657/g.82904 Transcript_50657/m.82904 type:complete len:203 (-) Transcript_50657:433-1041(-)
MLKTQGSSRWPGIGPKGCHGKGHGCAPMGVHGAAPTLFCLCSDLHVPRKRPVTRTGFVKQVKHNIESPAWTLHKPSTTEGRLFGRWKLSPADAVGCDCHAMMACQERRACAKNRDTVGMNIPATYGVSCVSKTRRANVYWEDYGLAFSVYQRRAFVSSWATNPFTSECEVGHFYNPPSANAPWEQTQERDTIKRLRLLSTSR